MDNMNGSKINQLYENGENISKYLYKESDLSQDKIIEISYDCQSGNYTNTDKNTDTKSGWENYSKKTYDFINNLNLDNFTLLEIGVGEGNFFYRVCNNLNNNFKAFGLDISLARLLYCEKLCHTNIKDKDFNLLCANFLKIPLKDNSIDFIISCHALEPNLGSEEKILKELYRVSSKYIILQEPQDCFGEEQSKRMKELKYIDNLISICKKLNYEVILDEKNECFFNKLNKSKFIVIKKDKSVTPNNVKYVSSTKKDLIFHLNNYYDIDNNQIYPIINNIPVFTTSILCNNFLNF